MSTSARNDVAKGGERIGQSSQPASKASRIRAVMLIFAGS